MSDVSQMDYEAILESSRGFQDVGDTLAVVNTALEAAIMILKTTAFIGLVGGHAVASYLANIQPKVERLSEKCREIATDLQEVVRSNQATDEGTTSTFQG